MGRLNLYQRSLLPSSQRARCLPVLTAGGLAEAMLGLARTTEAVVAARRPELHLQHHGVTEEVLKWCLPDERLLLLLSGRLSYWDRCRSLPPQQVLPPGGARWRLALP